MRVVVATAHGEPDVLEIRHQPEVSPGPGQVLVDVHAAGVNFMDTYLRRGLFMVIPPPFALGVDGAGVVAAVGEGVECPRVGDRVVWERVMGSYADQVLMDAERALPVPGNLPLEQAAAGLMQALTADHLCQDAVKVAPGETALVHSAASGVGRMLTQLITGSGGRVIGTVSRAEKVPTAKSAGAEEVLVRGGGLDLAAEVRARTDGRGADVVFDGTGADSCLASIASTARGGTYVMFGQAGGAAPPLELWEQPDGVRLMRSRGDNPNETPAEGRARASKVLSLIADGTLDVVIGARYPLDGAVRAHRDIESQATIGKLLLIPGAR